MWSFRKKTARRQEIRRNRTEREGVWYRRLHVPLGILGAGTTLATAVLAALIVTGGGPQLGLRPGQRIDRGLTARVDLRIADDVQTAKMRIRASQTSPNYYKLDTTLLENIRGRLLNALVLARANVEDAENLRREADKTDVVLDQAGANELIRQATLGDDAEYGRFVDSLIRKLRVKPLVAPPEGTSGLRPAASRSALIDPEAPQDRSEQLVFTNDTESVARIINEVTLVFPDALRPSMAETLRGLLTPTVPEGETPRVIPLYLFDTARTLKAAQEAEDEVKQQYREYPRGELLVAAGTLTAADVALLKIEDSAYRAAQVKSGSNTATLASLGRIGLVLAVVLGCVIFVSRYHPKAFFRNLRWTTMTLALLAILAVTRFFWVAGDTSPYFAVGAQAFAACLLGLAYAHVAVFAVCAALAILMTMVVEQEVAFLITALAASGALVFGLREVRVRGKIVAVGALAGALAFAISMAAELFQGQSLAFALRESLWGGLTTLLAAFVMEGILPGMERIFGLATGMTLLEWSDPNKKLLRTMAAEAPGTFNHSLIVATLAEAAAEAIGANGLLARAGAYYHDIGKINKPDYFVENQTPGINAHDRLSPAMSLLIIVGHVKDGVEMAKEYALPKPLHPFIAEHHGTTLVEYFYHAARKQRKDDAQAVSESEFRYPGPKPQSRETAVVMLCDGVEGAVRAMTEPTPNRIETVVSDIVRKRLMDGQLDECDLTFRELAEIERTLVNRLCSIYHARIAYPEKEEIA